MVDPVIRLSAAQNALAPNGDQPIWEKFPLLPSRIFRRSGSADKKRTARTVGLAKKTFEHYQAFIKRSYNSLEASISRVGTTVNSVTPVTLTTTNRTPENWSRLRYLRAVAGFHS